MTELPPSCLHVNTLRQDEERRKQREGLPPKLGA
jgi:hypothetical protein